MGTLAQNSGFFDACLHCDGDVGCSLPLEAVVRLVPDAARISPGARWLLPAVLQRLAGHGPPLLPAQEVGPSDAMINAPTEAHPSVVLPSSPALSERARALLPKVLPLVLKQLEGRSVSCPGEQRDQAGTANTQVAVRLLALGRFLLSDALRQEAMTWIETSGDVSGLFAALDGHEGYGLAEFLEDASPTARRRVAEGLQPTASKHDVAALLKDEVPSVRVAALSALRNLGSCAQPHLDTVSVMLRDVDAEVRSRAALCLSATGWRAAATSADKVAGLLGDDEASVRHAAAQSLANMGLLAAPFAAAVLREGGHRARRAAGRALGGMGSGAASILVDCLGSVVSDVRRVAVEALAESAGAAPYRAHLLELLQDVSGKVREAAVLALGSAWTSDRSAVPSVLEGVSASLGDDQKNVRRAAAQVLGAMGHAAAEQAGALSNLCDDSEWSVRKEAVTALAKFPVEAVVKYTSRISSLFHDDVSSVREAAVSAAFSLGGIMVVRLAERLGALLREEGPVQRVVIDAFEQILEGGTVEVREAVLSAARSAGEAALPLAGALASLTSSEDRHMREESARALGAVGPSARSHVSCLVPLLDDVTWAVRRAAAEALGSIGRCDCGEAALQRCVRDHSHSVRVAARRALAMWRLDEGDRQA